MMKFLSPSEKTDDGIYFFWMVTLENQVVLNSNFLLAYTHEFIYWRYAVSTYSVM